MTRPRRKVLLLGATAFLLALMPLAAQDDPIVFISSPEPGTPVFGMVRFAADPHPKPQGVQVDFLVDDELLATRLEPPWEIEIDIGDDNRPRQFVVRMTLPDGRTAESRLVTPAFEINEVVSAELQQMYVTVSRSGGDRVLNLEQQDFVVLDQGDRQDIVTFARGDVRVTAALLIDASASMKGDRLRNAVQGARAFLEGMRDIDDASIALFSDRLLHRTPFLNDSHALVAPLAGVEASGGTALNDHLYLSLKELERRQGRRVIILLSDGIDSHSTLHTAELRWLARRSRALIYWIRTGSVDEARKSRYSAWKNPDAYRRDIDDLTEIVRDSGGRMILLESLEQADTAFSEVIKELREQYVLGYYPSSARNDGSWHRTTVRVRGSLRVRAQAGYIDY